MLIKLNEGIIVEVDEIEGRAQPISGNAIVENVSSNFKSVGDLLEQIGGSFSDSIKNVSDTLEIEKMEVTLKVGFQGEGNVFVAKSKASANLEVKLTIIPKK